MNTYHKFIFIDQDGRVKVQPILITLLKLTTPKEFKIEEKHQLLEEFVTVVQSPPVNWMRPAGTTRGSLMQDTHFDENAHTILSYCEQLGLFDQQTSQEKNYDGAVMLGTSIYLGERFFELQNLMRVGVVFNKIFLMGSLDDISVSKNFLERQIKQNPTRFRYDIKIPARLTLQDAMLLFMENLLLPNDIQKKDVILLPAKGINPNTQDEYDALALSIDKIIKKNITKPKLAIFSNPPFCFRQNLIFQQLSNEYEVITLTGQEKLTNIAIILDELSRLFYQLNELIKENSTSQNGDIMVGDVKQYSKKH